MLRSTSIAYLLTAFLVLAARNAVAQGPGAKVVLTNDDGWAVAQIRAQRDALVDAGFDVVLSAPAVDKSGTGSSSATPVPLKQPCEFDSCPAGSPAEGFNASDPRLNYVNAFPVDAVRFGIQTLAPQFFGSPPDFVVSGPNVGNNLGSTTQISGTVGAACEAAKEGVPSIAFSASSQSVSQVSYTTLAAAPSSPGTLSARIYAALAANLTSILVHSSSSPILPPGLTLNVNFAPTSLSSSGGTCRTAADFRWVLTRISPAPRGTQDVQTCGTTVLPDEGAVVRSAAGGGCFASVSVMDASTKADVDAAAQGAVLARIAPSGLFSCLMGNG
ncbi:sure-like protein [Trametes polyzona]|nr:sure-like protein [Trametes polyzona]